MEQMFDTAAPLHNFTLQKQFYKCSLALVPIQHRKLRSCWNMRPGQELELMCTAAGPAPRQRVSDPRSSQRGDKGVKLPTPSLQHLHGAKCEPGKVSRCFIPFIIRFFNNFFMFRYQRWKVFWAVFFLVLLRSNNSKSNWRLWYSELYFFSRWLF